MTLTERSEVTGESRRQPAVSSARTPAAPEAHFVFTAVVAIARRGDMGLGDKLSDLVRTRPVALTRLRGMSQDV